MVKLRRTAAAAVLFAALGLSGCGYTTKSNLPESIRSIHVAPVKNAIDLSQEISNESRFRTYRPGVEVDLTNAIINRFIFDGNLRIATLERADAVVEAKLVDYRRDPLRYSEDDDVQEYRLSVLIEVAVYQILPGSGERKLLWQEKSLAGDATFFLSGPRAQSEDEAVVRAVEDTARRVVERTLELW